MMAKRLYQEYTKLFEKIFKSETFSSKNGLMHLVLVKKSVLIVYLFNLAEILGLFILSVFTSMTNYGKLIADCILFKFLLSLKKFYFLRLA